MPRAHFASRRGTGLQKGTTWKKYEHEQKRKERTHKKQGLVQVTPKKLTKDPGVPDLFPYKKEMLKKIIDKQADVTQAALQRVAAQQMAAQLQGQIATGELVQPHEIAIENQSEETKMIREHHVRKSAFKSELMEVIEKADVVIEVLDARDPENTRNHEAEEQCLAHKKPFILLLNKIDLIPKEAAAAWVDYYRRINVPAILFKCSMNIKKGSVRYANAATGLQDGRACVGSSELKSLVSKVNQSATRVVCAVIGYPNTGKSSVINSLANRPACEAAPIPGQTRAIQEVHIDRRLRILDSPGVVYNTTNSVVLREENLEDPIGEVQRIFSMVADPMQVYAHYEISDRPSPSDISSLGELAHDFCYRLGKKLGRIRQGGIVDQEQTAVDVVRDWNRGSLPFWRLPSQHEHARQVVGAWEGIDAAMLDNFNADVLGHLVQVNGLHLK